MYFDKWFFSLIFTLSKLCLMNMIEDKQIQRDCYLVIYFVICFGLCYKPMNVFVSICIVVSPPSSIVISPICIIPTVVCICRGLYRSILFTM